MERGGSVKTTPKSFISTVSAAVCSATDDHSKTQQHRGTNSQVGVAKRIKIHEKLDSMGTGSSFIKKKTPESASSSDLRGQKLQNDVKKTNFFLLVLSLASGRLVSRNALCCCLTPPEYCRKRARILSISALGK
jgi:hypothetical protein